MCNLDDEKELTDYKGMPVDIWALGVTSYILSYNKFPFYSENDDIFELYDKIHKSNFTIPKTPKRSYYFKHFLKRCLEKDPNRRITSEKILELKWLNQGEKEHLKNQCKRVVKIVPTKDEIFKNMVFFSKQYKDIEKLKDNKSNVIKEISNQILKKFLKLDKIRK